MKPFNKNKKGTALITVVGVMFVLLIVVSATMVLVMAAHNKAMTNYYKNQAYVTARSVVDSFVTQACSGKTSATTDDMRTQLIGTYSDSKKAMTGGMHYNGRDGDSAYSGSGFGKSNIENIDGVNVNYIDVPVTMPTYLTGSRDTIKMGDLYNLKAIAKSGLTEEEKKDPVKVNPYAKTVRIYRFDKTTFKIVATVKSGQNSEKPVFSTVAETIKLMPNKGKSMFDSALNTRTGSAILMKDAQFYGGYVNTDSKTSPMFHGKDTRYVGNFYSKSKITANDSIAKFFLGSDKKIVGSDTGNIANYMQSPKGIYFTGTELEIVNTLKDGDAPDRNPYIFVSDMLNKDAIKMVSGGSKFKVGQDGKPIDIYSVGNVILGNIDYYGDIYCQGNVTLQSGANIRGHIKCTGVCTVQPGASVNFRPSQKATVTIPVKIYDPVTFGNKPKEELNIFLNTHPYNKDPEPDDTRKIKIGECFEDATSHDKGNELATHIPATPGMPENPWTIPTEINSSMLSPISSVPNTYRGQIHWLGREATDMSTKLITTIKVKEDEDLFITCNAHLDGAKILIEPDGCTEDEMGNVYIKYIRPGSNDYYNNTEIGMSTSDIEYIKKSGQNRNFGTKGVNLEKPSHLFILTDTDVMDFQSTTNMVRAYIFAPGSQIYFRNGPSFGSGSTPYYDETEIKVGGKFNIKSEPHAIIFGSCISNKAEIGGSAGAFFIPPGPNIFDNSSDITLADYQWTPSLMDRK